MALSNIGGLLEKRRLALLDYSIGHVKKEGDKNYNFLKTPEDLFELLRLDPLDSYAVQNSWVAEAISCAQQYIHAVYHKLEPGFTETLFDKSDLATWELYSNYPDWAALQLIALYPENFINPFVRQRKTDLFKALENNLNQARLTPDSVQAALKVYLQTFEQTCNLDVLASYMDGVSPARAAYYFVGRERAQPFRYFWRKAQVELSTECVAMNPAGWGEWQVADIATGPKVLDMRAVFWNGRLCLIWAEWRDKVAGKQAGEFLPHKLDINLAFMTQNGQWSAPHSLHSREYDGDDLSAGARLIATVWADQQHPKGKLGVLLTNGKAGGESLEVFAVRDVLLRHLHDDGGWLNYAAEHRFVTAETVQHPLMNQPTIMTAVEVAGTLTPYLDLQAVAFRVGNDDVLVVQGLLRHTDKTGNAEFDLKLNDKTDEDPEPIRKNFPVAGGWSTEWQVFRRLKGSWAQPTTFSFGADTGGYGRKEFKLTIANVTDFPPPALLKNTLDAAQFLDLKQPGLKLKFTRLNSLFGPALVQLSNISVDAVLDWSTQFLPEPPPAGGTIDEPNGAFNGANGLFFWELFFHLPHLVATRLRDEERFLEAQKWLHWLFDPQGPADKPPAPNPKPLYWRCRPLTGDGNLGCEVQAPTDPDAIGYSAPVHFKILVFTEYVNNLIAWGDWYYRQLTRDSLVAAKLCYGQAMFLMGKAPSARTVNGWQADTVGNLLIMSGTRPTLEQFERTLDFSLADIPAASDNAPRLGLLANDPFKMPINQQLLNLFAVPKQRLDNLRNNRTLDGKPRDIPLFSPPTNPKQLLRDLASDGGRRATALGGRLVVGAFHWRVTFEAALRAVQTLQDYGNRVLSLHEQRDRAEQEDIQQNHLVELGDYAKTMQEQTIAQLRAQVSALEQSRMVAQERADAYERLHVENVTDAEYQVMEKQMASKIVALASASVKPAAAAIATIPKIFGTSNGNAKPEKIVEALSGVLAIASTVLQIDADQQATTEAYRRRRADWALQRNQALAEVRAFDEQITAQKQAVLAALTSLEQTVRANDHALSVLNFLKKRATNAELYGWLLGQLSALYHQAYDAVVSLCLSAQASLSAETGDYDSQIPLPQVWQDNRHGLTAGEHLRVHLIRMEQAYLQRHERRLELVKTISLRQLFDDKVDPQPAFTCWEDALDQLKNQGTLEFRLTQLLFDRDHPGHFCRQISSVEVDLPVLTGPYQNVRATLLQIGSMIATKATTQSVKYLHNPETAVAPADVQVNLRSGQQIALSVGFAENGMVTAKPDEGLLNFFENTGVVSRWVLKFPWPNKEPQLGMLGSLTDIIVRVRYTAKAGEPTFTRAVEDLVTLAQTPGKTKRIKGAGNHE